jgi:3-methyl-2-oxobutanoate hydroxymethyltransferase
MLKINEIIQKKGKEKIIMLTAYEYLTAKYLEQAGVDIILVGDSSGMIFSGHKDTLPVTVDDMIYHTKAVMRGAKETPVIVDMPFMSYQVSVEEAKKNAGKILKETGAAGVKMEGGVEICEQVRALLKTGIPVMGHTGMQPQMTRKYGGYPVIGKNEIERKQLIENCKALEEAGVFAIVLEKVKAEVAKEITEFLKIPTIGIGSGPFCDGQVLVTHDLLGAFLDFKPKFVKQYEKIGWRSIKAIKKFIDEVKKEKFPGKNYYF